MNKAPRISVILPVFNGAEYVRAAISSILDQSFGDFELIVINDGSTDQSEQVIRSFQDERIKYIFQFNRGLAATLNYGIDLSRGEFIARQDQDDVSSPDRFRKQMDFFTCHSETGMVGTWARIISKFDDGEKYHKHPTGYAGLLFELLFDNPFVHSSIMIRREVFKAVGLYSTDKNRQPPEDYELWSRVARKYAVANIPEVLHSYRQVPSGMSNDRANPFRDRIRTISLENIAYFANTGIDDQVVQAIAFLGNPSGTWRSFSPSLRRIWSTLSSIRSSISAMARPSQSELEAWETTVESIRKNYFERHIAWRYARLILKPAALIGKVQSSVRKAAKAGR